MSGDVVNLENQDMRWGELVGGERDSRVGCNSVLLGGDPQA